MAHLALLLVSPDAIAGTWHTTPAWGLDFHVPDDVVEVRDLSADEAGGAVQLWLRPPGPGTNGVVAWKLEPGGTLGAAPHAAARAADRCGSSRFKKLKPTVRETVSVGGLRTVWLDGTATTWEGETEAFACVAVEAPAGLVWSELTEPPTVFAAHRAAIESALLGVRVTDRRAATTTEAPSPPVGRCPTDANACVPEADEWIRYRYPPITSDTSPEGMKARWRTIAGWSGAVSDAALQAAGKPTWEQTLAMYTRACDEAISLGCTSVGMAWQALAMNPDEDTTHIEQEAVAAYARACALKDDHGCLQVLLHGAPPDYAGPSIAVLCGRGWDDACNYGR
jgi:hypothetical protein